MTNRVAVNDGFYRIWVAEVGELRRVLEAHGWTAWPRGNEWVWQEPDLGQHDDDDAEDARYPYTEACDAYALPLSWWDQLTEGERDVIPEFRTRPDLGRGCWLAPFGPSDAGVLVSSRSERRRMLARAARDERGAIIVGSWEGEE